MTELSKIIRETFTKYYFDLGVFRWANRNKEALKIGFLISFIISFLLAFLEPWCIAPWAFLFIGLITVVGIDHFIIGVSFNRMLIHLEEKSIHVSREYILYVCSDMLPK